MKGIALILVFQFLNGVIGISSKRSHDDRPLEEDSIVFGEYPDSNRKLLPKLSNPLPKVASPDDGYSEIEREAEVAPDPIYLSSKPDGRPSDSCGVPNEASYNKAIGGLLSSEGKYPWVAAMIYYDYKNRTSLTCSGVLISRTVVLTTAECLRRQRGIPDEIRIGTTRLDKRKNGGQAVSTILGIAHRTFDLQDLRGNIALVLLEDAVEINEFVEPACIADFPEHEIPRDLETAAWNFTEGLGGKLLTFKGEIAHPSKCNYDRRRRFDSKDICVYFSQRQDRVCSTDVGAPLMFEKNGRTYVLGILSHASTCDPERDTAAVYTSVPAYASWIKTKMAEISSLT